MDNIEICEMTHEHMDAILKINALSFHTPWSLDSLSKELDDNKFARYVTAIKDGIVIGYGGMWIILDEAHITNIAVHSEYRGIGAGNKIMESLIDICKMELIPSMTLEVRKSNIVAQNLYFNHGFTIEGIRKGYYEDNKEDGIIMWKRYIV